MQESSSLTPRQQLLKEVYEVMRPYQRDAAKDLLAPRIRDGKPDPSHLNYMDMGLGKSLTTAFAIVYQEAFPCIIVCTKSAMYVWEEELRKWFNEESIVYAGKPKERDAAWKKFVDTGAHFIITNFKLLGELVTKKAGIIKAPKEKGVSKSGTTPSRQPTPGTWKFGGLIADEIHRAGLLNYKTETYKLFHKLVPHIPVRYLLTGTPERKGVVDFFGPLSIVAPDKFPNYWSFVGRHCVKINTGFGVSIERMPKDLVGFRALLREHAVIMHKEDHLTELPAKQRQVIPIELDEEQARVYNELLDQMYSITDTGELVLVPGILALSVRLRQLLVCPQLLGLETRGAGIDTLLEWAEPLVAEAKPFVIFTPFKAALPYITQALKDTFDEIDVYSISGDLSATQFRDTWQTFQNTKSKRPRVQLCVILSGASFHATVADKAFFLGSEWDFNANAQAEDRLNRMGQKNAVTCYYLMYRKTIDDAIARRLNDKHHASNLVLTEQDIFQEIRSQINSRR